MESIKAKRIYSFIIDLIISNIIGLLFFSILGISETVEFGNLERLDMNIRYGLSLRIVVFLFYNLTFDTVNNGITFGKMIFSLKVMGIENGEKTVLFIRVWRTMLKMVSTVFIPISAVVYLYNSGSIHERFSHTKTITSQKVK